MMDAKNEHEKEYLVKVNKTVNEEITDRLREGIYIRELKRTAKPKSVERVNKTTLRIVLTEGMNREIRRMCEAVSLKVTELKRVRVLNVTLGNLKPGEYRVLSQNEIKKLKDMVWGKTNA